MTFFINETRRQPDANGACEANFGGTLCRPTRIRQGRIRAIRLGNGYRIPAEEVARICSAGLPATPPDN